MVVSLDCREELSNPELKPEYVVIWLHGLGADYNDFVPLVEVLELEKCVKFVFPNAPLRPITVNNGFVMRGWYDIKSFERIEEAIDFAGLAESIILVDDLIQKEVAQGFSLDRIIIAGFSQGGVVSYASLLNLDYKLGGIISLSCYLPYDLKEVQAKTTSIKQATPVFAMHGNLDMVVPYNLAVEARDVFVECGYSRFDWHEYPIAHGMSEDEIIDLRLWFKKIMN